MYSESHPLCVSTQMLYKIHVLDINVTSKPSCNSVRSEVLTVMTVKNIFFWDVMVCTTSTFEIDSEDGGLKFFWNAIKFLPNYTASHPKDRKLDYVIPLIWGSSVSSHHGLENHDLVPSRGMRFPSAYECRLTLGCTQLPVQWDMRIPSPGVK
jgi:hypothetical protein